MRYAGVATYKRGAGMERVNTGLRLLTGTVAALDAAGERMGGKSRAFVVEVLAALFADGLGPDTVVPISMMPPDTRAKKQQRAKPDPAGPPAVKKPRGRPRGSSK